MVWLKVYAWETQLWPQFQGVKVHRFQQGVLLNKLAKHFKVPCPELAQSHRRGANVNAQASGAAGSYHRGWLWGHRVGIVKLGQVTTLGTLLHEFAHHLNYCRWNGQRGHGRTFKRELKRCYTWGKRYLPGALLNKKGRDG